MIFPIVGYGHPALRTPAVEIDPDYPELEQLIADMFETMYNAQGVGLAAPQIGKSIRIFVVDGTPMKEDYEYLDGFKKVFINPQKIEETGLEWSFEEGCLSIPNIREKVMRLEKIVLRYLNEHFEEQKEVFEGMKARIVQHEYDHLEGVLFTDHISPMRRKLLKTRLNKVTLGQIDTTYPMKFSAKKK